MCVHVEVKDVCVCEGEGCVCMWRWKDVHTQTHTSALLHLLRIASTGDIVSANDSS